MPFEYKNQKNAEARETVDAMLLSMPSFCKTYVHAREGRISALSMLAYIQRINRFFDYLQENNSYFGNKKKTEIKLDDMEYLETEDIEEFAHWIRPAKESTVNNYLSAISSLYEHFCRKGKLKANPVTNVERGKKPPHEIIRLNEEQEKRFVNSVEHGTGLTTREQLYQQKTAMRDSAICLLLSRTGIRVSELVGLNINDVNLKEHYIKVLRKRNKPDIVYIDDEVTEKLREWIENKPKEEDAVFVVLMKGTSYGKRISVRSVEKLVKKYAIAGTPDIGYQITPHKLRATYATNMLKETEGNVALVQAELNHSSPTTTMLYADVSVMDKKGARNILMNRDTE